MKNIFALPGTQRAKALKRIDQAGYVIQHADVRHLSIRAKNHKHGSRYPWPQAKLTDHLTHIATQLEKGVEPIDMPILRSPTQSFNCASGVPAHVKKELQALFPIDVEVNITKRKLPVDWKRGIVFPHTMFTLHAHYRDATPVIIKTRMPEKLSLLARQRLGL